MNQVLPCAKMAVPVKRKQEGGPTEGGDTAPLLLHPKELWDNNHRVLTRKENLEK